MGKADNNLSGNFQDRKSTYGSNERAMSDVVMFIFFSYHVSFQVLRYYQQL